jgi:hypothetical protein
MFVSTRIPLKEVRSRGGNEGSSDGVGLHELENPPEARLALRGISRLAETD